MKCLKTTCSASADAAKYKLCGVGAKSRKGRTFVSYIEY